jgi:lycopene cyclase domain-containing protein
MNSLYLWIDIGILAAPLIFSFGKKMEFFRKWTALFPAILLTSVIFLSWDQWFTEMNVWGFNARYILGYYILDLPVEELLFFFCFTYACVFIYEVLRTYVKHNETFVELYRWFTLLFFGIACTLLYWYNDRLYTAVTCLVVSLVLGTHLVVIRRRYMSWFYFAYVVYLLPIVIIEAIRSLVPVLHYNEAENVGLSLMGIPVENFLYNLIMLAICIGLYEWFSRLSLRYRLRPRKQSS